MHIDRHNTLLTETSSVRRNNRDVRQEERVGTSNKMNRLKADNILASPWKTGLMAKPLIVDELWKASQPLLPPLQPRRWCYPS
jgi:hypothetical protein